VLGSDAAGRLDPETWAGAETQLADWARIYRPDQLVGVARDWIEHLDQDGPAPDEPDELVNELHLAKSRKCGGGRIKGQLDASTFDVLARAIRASLKPAADENKTLGQRQADALGEICEHALDDGYLPAEGGERPHITAIINIETMEEQARGRCWSSVGRPAPGRCAGCCARRRSSRWCWVGQPALDVGRRNVASPWLNARPWPPGTGDVLILGVIGRPLVSGASHHNVGASRRVKHYQPRDVM